MATAHVLFLSRRHVRNRVDSRMNLCGIVASVAVLALLLETSLARAGEPQEKQETGSVSIRRGQAVYQTSCLGCHGEKGDGNGPMARFISPRPRNFGEGKFRIVTTANAKPSDEDWMLVLNNGMPGSAMFSFAHLPDGDKRS